MCWEFGFQLIPLRVLTVEVYIVVISYACLCFRACTLLLPDRMDEYSGYREYLMSRRRWFFGLLAIIFLVDVVDAYLKGVEHLQSFGVEYPVRTVVFVGVCIAAMVTTNQRFHALFAIAALIYQLSWIFRQFGAMS